MMLLPDPTPLPHSLRHQLFGNVFLGMPLPLSAILMIIVSLITDVVGGGG